MWRASSGRRRTGRSNGSGPVFLLLCLWREIVSIRRGTTCICLKTLDLQVLTSLTTWSVLIVEEFETTACVVKTAAGVTETAVCVTLTAVCVTHAAVL